MSAVAWHRRLPVRLFALVWLSCVWFGSDPLNPNNATRVFAGIALVEQHTPWIDRFAPATVDKAQVGAHYALDKAPGATLMALPAMALAQAIDGGSAGQRIDMRDARFQDFVRLRLQLAVATTVAVLTALAACALCDLATRLTGNRRAGLAAALGYALGSTIWGLSTTLLGHAPAAALLTIATWAAWRGSVDAGGAAKLRYPLIAGGALGWTIAVEYPAAIPAVLVAGFASWRAWRLPAAARTRALLLAMLAGAAALVPPALYNQIVFGSPLRPGYAGVVGFAGMQQGMFGLTYPKPAALFGILFGLRRGLLWVAPVLALGVVGLVRMMRRPATRDLGLLAAGVAVAAALVNASYAYWDGGASTGPRHLAVAIPFLALGLAPVWAELPDGARRRWAKALLGLSMAIGGLIAATTIFASEWWSVPLVQANLARAARGGATTLTGDWLGWPPFVGVVLYAVLAVPLLRALVGQARREPAA